MSDPRLNHVQCLDARGLHRMAYWEWGDSANPRVLVCAHGLARQGRDFDALARAMSSPGQGSAQGLSYRVVCPDVVGRGASDALLDPQGYQIPAYIADMVTLLARLDAQTVHWVGTSMGGLIGVGLASLRGSPISRLVINDVGPTVNPEGIARIGEYLGKPLRFDTLEEGADYLRSISASFGPHTSEEWLEFSRPMFKPDGDGLKLHYDPNIALPFKALTPQMMAAGEAMTWAAYDAIRCPTLVVRGADSDLLTRETAQAMTGRGPKPRVHEFIGVGHAPTLLHDDQIAVVREFLLSP